MCTTELIFKDLYTLQFKCIDIIDMEYWSNYHKTLNKTHTIFNEQFYLCSYQISFLHYLIDNFYKQHLITTDDFQLYKRLLSDLKT